MIQSDSFKVLSAAAAIAIALAMGKAARAKGAGSTSFLAFLASVLGLLVCNILELSVVDDEAILLCSHVGYAFIAVAPAFWFRFAAGYGLGREIGTPFLRAALFVVPSATAVLAFLDPTLHAIWSASEIRGSGRARVNVVLGYGPWFWVHASYSYSLFAGGIFFILREVYGNFEIYRRQAALLVCGVALPIAFNLCYVFRLFPGQVRDYSTIALAASGLLFSTSLSKYMLLDLSPPTRENLGDYLDEGALFVDDRGRILYCNNAGARMLRMKPDETIGRLLADLLPRGGGPVGELFVPDHGARAIAITDSDRTLEISAKTDRTPGAESQRYFVELRVEPIDTTDPCGAIDLSKSLSSRELQIAKLFASGASQKEIAAKLFVSMNTVKTHIRHIYRKAGVSTKQELRSLILDGRSIRHPGGESPINHP